MKALLQDPVFRVLSLTAFVLAVVGEIRPRYEQGPTRDQLYREKLSWSGCCDMVLLGDSRIFQGLSPAEMESELPGWRIRNLAFDALGYTDEYFEYVLRVLDANSRHRTIVMGITPHILTMAAAQENAFARLQDKRVRKIWEPLQQIQDELERGLRRYEALKLGPLMESVKLKKIAGRFFHNYDDGWCETDNIPHNPKAALRHYRTLFENNTVSPQQVAVTLDFVEKCVQQGIQVFAVRPPTGNEIFELEAAVSNFDEAAFRQAFLSRGGQWIDVNRSNYVSYDGSHLAAPSAREFSREIAKAVRLGEQPEPIAPVSVKARENATSAQPAVRPGR